MVVFMEAGTACERGKGHENHHGDADNALDGKLLRILISLQ
jgi:hypothetical protein